MAWNPQLPSGLASLMAAPVEYPSSLTHTLVLQDRLRTGEWYERNRTRPETFQRQSWVFVVLILRHRNPCPGFLAPRSSLFRRPAPLRLSRNRMRPDGPHDRSLRPGAFSWDWRPALSDAGVRLCALRRGCHCREHDLFPADRDGSHRNPEGSDGMVAEPDDAGCILGGSAGSGKTSSHRA